ncbi:MAG: alpha-hydroxy-acid oxidizing protein, partial [Rhodospirillales bacterium]|nr:alpha-hydroxy-acid oxidizing protein [Rhodospirillales bacterium]
LMTDLAKCHNIADLRAAAKKRLPRFIFEFVDRGTEDELALRDNRAAIDRIKLLPRFARNVSSRDLGTTLLGGPASMPLAIAPTGAAGLMWYRGEIELARAAAEAKVPFTMATGSMTALDELAR